MSKNLQKALFALLVVALIVRIWRLDGMPPAIHPDEMAGLTGVLDELSGRAPLRPFFDYRIFYLPLTGIGEYISSLFFGYNAWAYRLPSVLYGLVTILCTFGFTRRLTKDDLSAILAAAVSALLPWEIVVSRIGWENATMLPFLLGGLWALAAGIEENHTGWCALAGALLGIDAYSYRAALPDALTLAAALVVLQPAASRRARRGIAIALCAGALTIAPLVWSVATYPSFFWRDLHISTFHDGINATTLARFGSNYLAHFDPGPLFFYGDGNPEHGPRFGVLYLWMLPFIIAGFVLAFRIRASLGLFALTWLLLYPVGGAITNDGVPHFLRTLAGAPLAAMLCGMGMAGLWRAIRGFAFGRVATVLFACLVAVAFSQFCQSYFIAYVPAAADAFQYGNRELFVSIRRQAHAGQRVCFAGMNDMNALTLFSYYLRDMHLDLRERLDVDCYVPGVLFVLKDRAPAPPGARLLATTQSYDGAVAHYIFLTK